MRATFAERRIVFLCEPARTAPYYQCVNAVSAPGHMCKGTAERHQGSRAKWWWEPYHSHVKWQYPNSTQNGRCECIWQEALWRRCMVYPAFCGGADGKKINIFSIPSQNAPQAQAQGFTLLTQLPNAQRVQCHNPSPSIPPSMTPQPLSANGQPFVPYTGGNNSSYYSYH